MSNGSEHTPERCVHAVDGPDWAGLREPASWQELAMAAKARCEKAETERDALQGSLTIESGAVQELRARCDAMEADRDEWRSTALRERAEVERLRRIFEVDGMAIEYLPGRIRQRLVGPWTGVPKGDDQ